MSLSSYAPGYCGTPSSYRSGGAYANEYDALDYRRQPYGGGGVSGGGRRRGSYDFPDQTGPFL